MTEGVNRTGSYCLLSILMRYVQVASFSSLQLLLLVSSTRLLYIQFCHSNGFLESYKRVLTVSTRVGTGSGTRRDFRAVVLGFYMYSFYTRCASSAVASTATVRGLAGTNVYMRRWLFMFGWNVTVHFLRCWRMLDPPSETSRFPRGGSLPGRDRRLFGVSS